MSDFTFSEHGEDILIHRLLLWKENGFYVDVGCYHPRNMSMTPRLRNFGWNGINIDADERVIKRFNTELPHLTNLCVAITDKNCDVVLRRYEDSVINTISQKQKNHLDNIEKNDGLFTKQLDESTVEAKSLTTILDSFEIEQIDFLNLDIEEMELEALRGFPFDKYLPSVIACEIHRLVLENSDKNEIVHFLMEQGYILQSYIFHTAIFIRKNFDTELCHRVQANRL